MERRRKPELPSAELGDVLRRLRSLSDPRRVEGMVRYGISSDNTYGVSIPDLRRIARELGHNHDLAQELWSSEVHEARILATMVDEPEKVTEEQMERWVNDFDSWDMCDQCCNNLFKKTRFGYRKAEEWSKADAEYVKRAGFVLMATLAVGDKEAEDERFLSFLPMIRRESDDGRNFVKKAVSWALRQIGKRNRSLNREALKTARQIEEMDSRAAKWIASDAIKELQSEEVQKRLKG
jgi:3-methyladenine DNA glycosylase AlkD